MFFFEMTIINSIKSNLSI